MKKKIVQTMCGITAFIITAALLSGVAWLGGYDFDHRSPDVACGASLGLMLSAVSGAIFGIALWK